MNGDIKIGKLLCDEDIITQLNRQRQVKGDKRTLGEILVDLGFCEFDDITNCYYLITIQMVTRTYTTCCRGRATEEPKKEEPIELSEEKVMGTKFTMSLQTFRLRWLLYVTTRDRVSITRTTIY